MDASHGSAGCFAVLPSSFVFAQFGALASGGSGLIQMPAAAPFVVLLQAVALDCATIAAEVFVAWFAYKAWQLMRAAAK